MTLRNRRRVKIGASIAVVFLAVLAAFAIGGGFSSGSKPSDTAKIAEQKAEIASLKAAKNEAPATDVVKYGSGKDLFAVAGTPDGFSYDGVSDVSKARVCGDRDQGHLVRSNVCRTHKNGQVECKDLCKLPNGKLVGKLTWN